jgi:hypothetical protein
MFKRLFWMLVGASLGFGASFWVVRAVRQTVERYAPRRVSNELSEAVRSLRQDLRLAIAEGRDAMREREAALRDELEPPRPSRR